MAKIISPQHITGEKGVVKFASFCINHSPYLIFREESKNDFGIDGEVELSSINNDNKIEATGQILKIQLKSTVNGGSYITEDKPDSFKFIANSNDIEYWNKHLLPVILVVYIEKEDKLFAKTIDKTLVTSKPNVKITFDKKANLLIEKQSNFNETINQNFVDRIQFGVKEKIFTNIFTIDFPKFIYKYDCKFKSNKAIYEILNDEGIDFPKFTVKSNFLYTFTDLKIISPNILDKILSNRKAIETNLPLKFIQSKKDHRNIIIEIINSNLKSFFYKKRINYYKEHNRFYFSLINKKPLKTKVKSENKSTEVYEQISYSSKGKRYQRSVVSKYYYFDTFFFKHIGFQIKYEWFDNFLVLIIEPKYHYSQDGKIPLDNPKRITRLNNQIKVSERNAHYNNHITSLTNYLGGNYWKSTDGFEEIGFKRKFFDVNFGIRELNPKKVFDEETQQLSLFD